MPQPALQLVWLRSDQRSRDNTALYQASRKGPVICVWCSFEQQWREHHDSPNKLWFWQENLKILEKNLDVLNIPLVTRRLKKFREAPEALFKLAQKLKCEAIWFNEEYGANEQNRDKEVQQLFNNKGLKSYLLTDDCLIRPGSVVNKEGAIFKVFTPFRKAVYRQLSPADYQPLPPPKKQSKLSLTLKNDKLPCWKPTAENILKTWPAGEKAAHKKLKCFIEERAEDYQHKRDLPAISGTSHISPYLTAGILSIRQCFSAAARANNGELDTGSHGLTCWLNELIWREFYRHILVGYPRVSKNLAFQKQTDKLPWKNNKKHLQAWQQGRTGYPIVDAAMRQLVATGWMHNRLRMICSMFLAKDLMLDWRLGEQFFMEHLLDGDLASNNGGWQWSASTGTDAAPYFRIFNPISQSTRFDSKGDFIRYWLPELKDLSDRHIHNPYINKADSGPSLNGYPKPIISHDIARKEAIEAFKRLKQ